MKISSRLLSREGTRDDASSSSSHDDGPREESVNTEHEMDRVRQLVSKEAFHVRQTRMLVFLTLLSTGCLVCVLVYVVLLIQNEENIKDAFNEFVDLIEQDLQTNVISLMNVNQQMSTTITVEGDKSNGAFPYAIIPYFEAHARDARIHAGLDFIMYGPVVDDLEKWANLSNAHRDWIQESLAITAEFESDSYHDPMDEENDSHDTEMEYGTQQHSDQHSEVGTLLKRVGPNGSIVPYEPIGQPPFLPVLQYSPPLSEYSVYDHVDLFSMRWIKKTALEAAESGETAFSPMNNDILDPVQGQDRAHHVFGAVIHPVYRGLSRQTKNVVGFLVTSVAWDSFFARNIPPKADDMLVYLNNTCGESAAYEIHNGKASFVGFNKTYHENDLYRPQVLRRVVNIVKGREDHKNQTLVGKCLPFFEVIPLQEFPRKHNSNLRYAVTLGIGAVSFGLMGFAFFLFDAQFRKQDEKMARHAAQSNTVLASLFPAQVRDRMFQEEQNKAAHRKAKADDDDDFPDPYDDKDESDLHGVIADLYPETSILFADIAGFTAWSSMQEPKQVFVLLETIFQAFDEIAQRRRIFKVETVGDCYVAAAGLPTKRKEHAVAMARFASDCMRKMWRMTSELEVLLGPSTGDLAMRMGIHSGPVTAGILRGDRVRFQLFGDTMNTASRIETTGLKNCIHLSADTANLLIEAGKSHWVKPREDCVQAKGKGELKTYWLEIGAMSERSRSHNGSSSEGSSHTDEDDKSTCSADTARSVAIITKEITNSKHARLIEWNVDIMLRLLKRVAAHRAATTTDGTTKDYGEESLSLASSGKHPILAEVTESVSIPACKKNEDLPAVTIDDEATVQLRHFISSVFAMYRENPFHSFEHAAHMFMSISKLFSRIVANYEDEKSSLHNPLAQFTCALGALIHDIDHPAVPNSQLVREGTEHSKFYRGRSISEQNSVELAITLIMDTQFDALRSAIYTNKAEMQIFRQVLINSVMSTDILDEEFNAWRNERWEQVFGKERREESPLDSSDRRATIIMEHMMQASDIAHTMQHWNIYCKWNERLFVECYRAYEAGRAEADPCTYWYKGELTFFDTFVIPLARKLKECGAFGVCCDEYLNCATQNRDSWESQGKHVIASVIEKIKTGQIV